MVLPNKIGWWGERLVAAYLQQQGFRLLDHHYLQRWGELDLVMSCAGKVHFIEVKSTVVPITDLPLSAVVSSFRPEQHVNANKLNKLRRMAETWMNEFHVWSHLSIDVAAVYISPKEKTASVEIFWGVA